MASNPDNGPGLTSQDFHSVRAEVTSDGIKGLFLLNGGGAVALLAFLQAIWDRNPLLARYVLVGIAVMAFGAFIAGFPLYQ
jgi:hypothetical protein